MEVVGVMMILVRWFSNGGCYQLVFVHKDVVGEGGGGLWLFSK